MELRLFPLTGAGRGEEDLTQVARLANGTFCHPTVLTAHYWVFLTKKETSAGLSAEILLPGLERCLRDGAHWLVPRSISSNHTYL